MKLATRASRLAVAQTKEVIAELAKHGYDCELVSVKTAGDTDRSTPLSQLGGNGVFVSAIEKAVLSQKADCAVHSAKDLPVKLAKGMVIAAVLKRQDPRDVLITQKLRRIPETPIIGTGSLRRRDQFPQNAIFSEIRGNIDSRLDSLANEEFDGIILAAAGLNRLGLENDSRFDFEYFSEEIMVPAPGQGFLAVEVRENSEAYEAISKINDIEAMLCLRAERKVLETLNAGCHQSIGAYAEINDEIMSLKIFFEGKTAFGRSPMHSGNMLAVELSQKILEEINEL